MFEEHMRRILSNWKSARNNKVHKHDDDETCKTKAKTKGKRKQKKKKKKPNLSNGTGKRILCNNIIT